MRFIVGKVFLIILVWLGLDFGLAWFLSLQLDSEVLFQFEPSLRIDLKIFCSSSFLFVQREKNKTCSLQWCLDHFPIM